MDLTSETSPKNRFTEVRTLGSEAPRRKRLLPGIRRRKLPFLFMNSPYLCPCQDADAPLDFRPYHDLRTGVGREDHLQARSELDETDTLAGTHRFSLLFPADDAARYDSGDLRKTHRSSLNHKSDYISHVFNIW